STNRHAAGYLHTSDPSRVHAAVCLCLLDRVLGARADRAHAAVPAAAQRPSGERGHSLRRRSGPLCPTSDRIPDIRDGYSAVPIHGVARRGLSLDKAELLQQLRIDRGQKVDHGDRGRTRWLAGAALAVLILAAAGAYLLLRGKPFAVEAATAAAPSVNSGPTAILQATGYVTARRQATVSAQITGTLTQVLIEEGEHVKAGQVLARLEDTAQRA